MRNTFITEYGKLCRKIRIDNNQTLSDMAKLLNVTSAYLSAVETGKRNVPKNWPKELCAIYNLADEMVLKLESAAFISQKFIKFDTTNLDNNKKQVLLLLSNKISNLSDNQLQKLIEIIK